MKLITYKDKICVPKTLQKCMIQWYHEMLCHPGSTCTETTIAQHFYWKNLQKTVRDVCSKCDLCQRTKRIHNINYGKLSPKKAEATSWQNLCIDLIGPYDLQKRDNVSVLQMWAITMIDPATGWLEIAEIDTKCADVIANVAEQTWLTQYPWPEQVTYDHGTEFMAELSKMIKEDYNINRKPIMVCNPQANAIVERVHQTIHNMIRTFKIQDSLHLQEAIPGIFAAIAFGICSIIHITMQATPMLVFGRTPY